MTEVGNLPKIKSARALEDHLLEVRWDSGLITVIDLSEMVSAGGVFTFLRDKKNFGQVKLGRRRRTVEWIDQNNEVVDIDADTLLQMGQDQLFFRRLRRALGQPTP